MRRIASAAAAKKCPRHVPLLRLTVRPNARKPHAPGPLAEVCGLKIRQHLVGREPAGVPDKQAEANSFAARASPPFRSLGGLGVTSLMLTKF